jgi:hypothetical protein
MMQITIRMHITVTTKHIPKAESIIYAANRAKSATHLVKYRYQLSGLGPIDSLSAHVTAKPHKPIAVGYGLALDQH